jgi:hypothetical protein
MHITPHPATAASTNETLHAGSHGQGGERVHLLSLCCPLQLTEGVPGPSTHTPLPAAAHVCLAPHQEHAAKDEPVSLRMNVKPENGLSAAAGNTIEGVSSTSVRGTSGARVCEGAHHSG